MKISILFPLAAIAVFICANCGDTAVSSVKDQQADDFARKFSGSGGRVTTFTITFNANSGTVSPTSATTGTNGKLTSLPTPTRTNFTFTGWFTAATGGTAVTVDRVYTANTTIFAQWTANTGTTHTLTINRNPTAGGTVTQSGTSPYAAGTSVTVTATANSGYTFTDWTGAPSGVNASSASITFNINANLTLTANFQQQQMQIVIVSDTTIKVGTLTWMRKNLNVVTANSWCHGILQANCDKYGRLYNWDAARNACPTGWRLPTRQEWQDLFTAVGGASVAGRVLKARAPDWDGDDTHGFSALPGGLRFSNGGFGHLGDWGLWWSATGGTAGSAAVNAYYVVMDTDYSRVFENLDSKSGGLSVRCVRN